MSFLNVALERDAGLEHLDGDLEQVVEALGLGLGGLPRRACLSALYRLVSFLSSAQEHAVTTDSRQQQLSE